MGIREGMPLLAKHEGYWEGTYTYLNPAGEIIDQHTSLLSCLFTDDEKFPYHQTNTYTWADGKQEVHEFPGSYDGYGRMNFDTERIKGVCWDVDENTIYLTWIYKAEGEDLRLYELIVLDDSGTNRCRTWQWVRDGVIEMRTVINETRTERPAA